jgi:hypothetical protein
MRFGIMRQKPKLRAAGKTQDVARVCTFAAKASGEDHGILEALNQGRELKN